MERRRTVKSPAKRGKIPVGDVKKAVKAVKAVKKRRITVASAKGKARNQQNRVAKLISELLSIPYGKDEDIESRQMGQAGSDIILHGDARKRFKYEVECKNQEALAVPAWIRQAKKYPVKGRDWLLVFKCKALTEDMIVMDKPHFKALLTEANIFRKRKLSEDMSDYFVMCRSQKSWRMLPWLAECKKEAKALRSEWVMWLDRPELGGTVAVLRMKHFFELLTLIQNFKLL